MQKHAGTCSSQLGSHISLHLVAFEVLHMYDDKLLRLKDVQELHHIGKSDEALKNFGFSSDDIDLI